MFETFSMDDYVFEPCGYSMNGINDEHSREYSTVHITPEDEFSYASVELSNVDLMSNARFSVSDFVNKCATVFKPGKMTFALTFHHRVTVDISSRQQILNLEPFGILSQEYSRESACFQKLPNNRGFVAYLNFTKLNDESDESTMQLAAIVDTTTTTKYFTAAVADQGVISRSETPACVLEPNDTSDTDSRASTHCDNIIECEGIEHQ